MKSPAGKWRGYLYLTTFQHTHISLLAKKQSPLKTIMTRVGHNEPKTTLSIYTHVTDAMKEQEKQILDSIDIMA